MVKSAVFVLNISVRPISEEMQASCGTHAACPCFPEGTEWFSEPVPVQKLSRPGISESKMAQHAQTHIFITHPSEDEASGLHFRTIAVAHKQICLLSRFIYIEVQGTFS